MLPACGQGSLLLATGAWGAACQYSQAPHSCSHTRPGSPVTVPKDACTSPQLRVAWWHAGERRVSTSDRLERGGRGQCQRRAQGLHLRTRDSPARSRRRCREKAASDARPRRRSQRGPLTGGSHRWAPFGPSPLLKRALSLPLLPLCTLSPQSMCSVFLTLHRTPRSCIPPGACVQPAHTTRSSSLLSAS